MMLIEQDTMMDTGGALIQVRIGTSITIILMIWTGGTIVMMSTMLMSQVLTLVVMMDIGGWSTAQIWMITTSTIQGKNGMIIGVTGKTGLAVETGLI